MGTPTREDAPAGTYVIGPDGQTGNVIGWCGEYVRVEFSDGSSVYGPASEVAWRIDDTDPVTATVVCMTDTTELERPRRRTIASMEQAARRILTARGVDPDGLADQGDLADDLRVQRRTISVYRVRDDPRQDPSADGDVVKALLAAVYCIGGPLDGQGFTEKDWQTRLEAARNLGDAGQGHALGYAASTVPADLRGFPKAAEALAGYAVTWMRWSR
jgi:hypothetical protein